MLILAPGPDAEGPGKVWGCGGCLATQAAPAQVPCILTSLQYMEKLSQLAYHPLKMQSCYEKMEPLRLDGLQQRFDVSSTSVFKQRAQIHMREVGLRLLPQHPPHPPSAVPTSGRAPRPYSLGPASGATHAQPQHVLSRPGLECSPHLLGTPVLFTWLMWTHLSGLSLETPSSRKPSLLPKPCPTSVSDFLEARTGPRAQCCASTLCNGVSTVNEHMGRPLLPGRPGAAA